MAAGTYTVTRASIPERIVEGKRLGRTVHHDSRSLRFLVPGGERPTVRVEWPRRVPIFDQGEIGSCTANAAIGCLGTDPFTGTIPADITLDEAFAVTVYSDEERADGGGGYPPQDVGSSGLTAGKVLASLDLIAGYQHITSVDAAWTAIAAGPFIVGTNWLTGMDRPNAAGIVRVSGTVRGGHEYLCRSYDPASDLWGFDNSWGTAYGAAGSFSYTGDDFARLLDAQGDATVFTPLSEPAPTPSPAPPTADAALLPYAREYLARRHSGLNAHLVGPLTAWVAAQ